jgi:hypothetical protein
MTSQKKGGVGGVKRPNLITSKQEEVVFNKLIPYRKLTTWEMSADRLQHTQGDMKPNDEKLGALTCSGQKKIRAGQDEMGPQCVPNNKGWRPEKMPAKKAADLNTCHPVRPERM